MPDIVRLIGRAAYLFPKQQNGRICKMEGYRCKLDWAGYLDFLESLSLRISGLFFFPILYLCLSLLFEIWSLDRSDYFLFLALVARILAV